VRVVVRSVAAAVALALLAACSIQIGSGGPGSLPAAQSVDLRGVTVGAFDFTESEILAQLYAQALRAKGYAAGVLPGLGPRELVDPALTRGLIELVPEYSGSALQFVTVGRELGSPSAAETQRSLAAALAPLGLVAMDPSPAQDVNAIVVTRRTAERYGLRSISDLAAAAPQLAFGGPPECADRAFCLKGLRDRYGMHFKEVVALDAGGPLTLQALAAGEIDVALLFSTDPAILKRDLVVLSDDRHLQPAENVTPVADGGTVAKLGPGFADVVNSVSERLTTRELLSLNELAGIPGQTPAGIAAGWLRSQGLV
jgi:osmoprotectant transport system substrate-binding protein